MKNLITICVTAILSAIMFSCSQKPTDPVAKALESIDSLFTERYACEKDAVEPGGTVLIIKGDSILYQKSWGYADLEKKTKIDGNTSFNIASCSKQFTAVAALKLDSEGIMDIEKSIYDVTPLALPYLPKKGEPFTKITVAHLLSHASGIPDARPRDDWNFTHFATDMESIGYIKDLKALNFEPGTEYQYINPTFDLVYMYIEKLTGMSFEEYMKKNIFTPAGMDKTLYFSPENEPNIPNMAHGYILSDPEEKNNVDSDKPAGAEVSKAQNVEIKKFGRFEECDYGEETFFATKADGGIYTSINQYAKWIAAMRDDKVINERQKSRAWSPINCVSNSKLSTYQNRPNTYYGYGWFVEQQPEFPMKVYHTGDNGGFQCYEGYYPESDVLVVILENRNDKDRWSAVKTIDELLLKANLLQAELPHTTAEAK
ncbi:MAG: serine hydrolase domain-containing protein [Candidatus Egerieousia sp.]